MADPPRDPERNPSILTDRDEVRRWGDERGFVPVGAEGRDVDRDTDLVHEDRMESHHEERDWNTFLDEFEERNFALAYTEGQRGDREEFAFVDRTHVDERGELSQDLADELLAGETVETTVTEREVVETEVVEEAMIESEIVDSQVIDSHVVDTEIVGEELVDVYVMEEANADVIDADARRSVDSDERIEFTDQGAVVLEVEEERIETEEKIEEKTIESRVVDQDVETDTTVADESVDVDIEIADVHDHLGRSGLVDTDADIIDERYIETEMAGDDVATSTLTEHQTVENLVTERKFLTAEFDAVEMADSDVVSETIVESDVVEADADVTLGSMTDTGMTETESGMSETETGMSETETGMADTESELSETEVAMDETEPGMSDTDSGMGETTGSPDVDITENTKGQTVEMPDGEEIGIVADVDAESGVIYVDEDPSLTDKIKASLDWGQPDEDAMLTSDQIEETRRDAVVVRADGLRD